MAPHIYFSGTTSWAKINSAAGLEDAGAPRIERLPLLTAFVVLLTD